MGIILVGLLAGCEANSLLVLRLVAQSEEVNYRIYDDAECASFSADETSALIVGALTIDSSVTGGTPEIGFPIDTSLQSAVVRIELEIDTAGGQLLTWCGCPKLPPAGERKEIEVIPTLGSPPQCQQVFEGEQFRHLGLGVACEQHWECQSGHCECTDAACEQRVCAAESCTCGWDQGGGCTHDLDGIADPGDCEHLCVEGKCRLPVGSGCVQSVDCETGTCACTDAQCNRAVCTEADSDTCRCRYIGEDGTCSAPVEDGLEDTPGCEQTCMEGECKTPGGNREVGESCLVDSACESGHCVCADEDCAARVCHESGCGICSYDADGLGACSSTPAGNRGELCHGDGEACSAVGSCSRALGSSCGSDSECASGICACANDGCSAGICHSVGCRQCEHASSASTCMVAARGEQGEECVGRSEVCDGTGRCLLVSGTPCQDDRDCLDAHCECANDGCSSRVCHESGCGVCEYSDDGSGLCSRTSEGRHGESCTGDNERCSGAGTCVGLPGVACQASNDCSTGFCVCADDGCSGRVCHEYGCGTCQFSNSSGSSCLYTSSGKKGQLCDGSAEACHGPTHECRLAPGAVCSLDGDCASEACECGVDSRDGCSTRRCHDSGCGPCEYTTDGASCVPVSSGNHGESCISAGETCVGEPRECRVRTGYACSLGDTCESGSCSTSRPDGYRYCCDGAGPCVSAVGAGGDFTCATLVSNEAHCWGNKANGRLGNGEWSGFSLIPVPVVGLDSANGLACGASHTVAWLSDGSGAAWGANDYGKLGNGDTVDRSTPASLSGLSGVEILETSAGFTHSCARLSSLQNRRVKCWGSNGQGQLGTTAVPLGDQSSSAVSVCAASGCPAELENVISIAASGDQHTCAVQEGGTAFCWGYDLYGQLGDDASTGGESALPVPVFGITDALQVTAGSQHSCALRAGGVVSCWGLNLRGQLGDDSTVSRALPVDAVLPGPAVQVAAGSMHTCAVMLDGELMCWGENSNGQLGLGLGFGGYKDAPETVNLLSGVVAVFCGSDHTCAVTRAGRLYCWGRYGSGRLGVGAVYKDEGSEEFVTAIDHPVEVVNWP